jgi:hypothetical protein
MVCTLWVYVILIALSVPRRWPSMKKHSVEDTRTRREAGETAKEEQEEEIIVLVVLKEKEEATRNELCSRLFGASRKRQRWKKERERAKRIRGRRRTDAAMMDA